MAAKFEITKDKAGKFRFRLKAGNGEIIAVSEPYESMESARNGIASVQKNAGSATIVDLTTTEGGGIPPGGKGSKYVGAAELAEGAGAGGEIGTPPYVYLQGAEGAGEAGPLSGASGPAGDG